VDLVDGRRSLVLQRRAAVPTAVDSDSVPRAALPRNPADNGNAAGGQNFDFDPRVGSVAGPPNHVGDCLGRRHAVRKILCDPNPGSDMERQASTVAKHCFSDHIVWSCVSVNAGIRRPCHRPGPPRRKLTSCGFDHRLFGSRYGAAGRRKHLSRNSLSNY